MNTFNHHTGKEWKIRPRPKLSWLLFRWGKDVYDNEDQKIMSFEHSFLSKITHKYTWFHSLTVFILYTFTFLWLLLNNIIYFPASSIWQQLLIGPIFFLLFFFLLSPFLPLFFRQRKYVIKDRNRKLAGNISCNWGNSLWTVTDHLKKSVATVNFTTREIITHSGSFTISPSTKHGEFFKVIVKNTVDPSGFTIVRKEKISRLSLSRDITSQIASLFQFHQTKIITFSFF